MKKRYKKALLIIFILFLGLLGVSTGYGVWTSIRNDEGNVSSTTLNCFKIYYSNETDEINMVNIVPMLNEEGIETSPYTVTITNICNEEKELQLRLNLMETTNVNIDSLTIKVSGNIENEVGLFKNLKNVKTTMTGVKNSKLLGVVKIPSGSTVRSNVKLWFDEKKVNDIGQDTVLNTRFELVDAAAAGKNNFAETIILDHQLNEAQVDYASMAGDGLFKIANDTGEYYYFRGVVEDNYVNFAGHVWRIVGIDNNQAVKLVYNGNVGNRSFSKYRNAIDYTGIKYVYNGVSIDNQINKFLISWYEENIFDKGYDKNVAEANYCNDSSSTLEGYHRYFGAYTRIISNKAPSVMCPETSEDFGGLVKQKIALFTIDEVALAGLVDGANNTTNYLYQANDYYIIYKHLQICGNYYLPPLRHIS